MVHCLKVGFISYTPAVIGTQLNSQTSGKKQETKPEKRVGSCVQERPPSCISDLAAVSFC